MRIVIVAFAYMEYTIELANALVKKEKVMLIIPESKSRDLLDFIDPRIEKVITPFPRLRNPMNLYWVYRTVHKIRRFNPHIIHFQGGFLWYTVALPLLENFLLVTTIHDANIHSGDKPSQKIALFQPNALAASYSAKIIVHGEQIKQNFLKSNPIDAEKVVIIPHGDFTIYNKWKKEGVQEDNNFVLFFGRIWKYKGLEYLIQAAPKIAQEIPDVKIIIAGTGEPIDRYLEIIHNPQNFLIYNYHVPNEMVAWLFQKSALVVLPYIEASQSGVIPLAYSFGKPVIATRVGSIPEIVENGITGLIIDPMSATEIADAVIELLKDSDKRKKMGQMAYTKICQEFSWERVARMTLEVYRTAWKTARNVELPLDGKGE
ncbi:glycosyltransferase family 4 protein [candidate division KSB1 bacterium]|nr:glycosyltransferase family 4 protein [candidate division KSB1 bacterium]